MYNMEEDSKDLIEALSSIDANLWQEAINDEMDSLESNRIWHLVDLPLSCKAIGCKWVLRKKLNSDGSVDKYTARLVAKGFRQRKNMNFFDTFSAITRIISIRVLFAIATLNNLLVHQMDVKIALLNGDLEEEIYMEQPEDDMLIFGSNLHVTNNVKSMLYTNFDMKDLRESNVILRIKITQSETRTSLEQSFYIEKIMKKYNYFENRPACTPYDPSVKLFKSIGGSVNQSEYASIIVIVDHVWTDDNLADPLTKGLVREKVSEP
ncbi:hypothetical protein E5676_scaffold351G00170 [Cucumis melo var. makuwa]|uniref:Reverse transcriptase Ty1/copia-type domain-containing protein n=1 Tax=Cucumis melo var. makuwa TaxID=1194695 RepID=A0A5D3BXY1_CUCMM|nr:hypothetical protein E5676_scaffold351G00170 [Cucumis melo var. makuwa]